jgi:hypothetical protein
VAKNHGLVKEYAPEKWDTFSTANAELMKCNERKKARIVGVKLYQYCGP